MQNDSVGTPANWDSPSCTWLVEDLGANQIRIENLGLQQTYDYLGDLNCDTSAECIFNFLDSTAGNTVFTVDEDECAAGVATCGSNSTCVNTDGGYDCVCDPFFTKNGTDCTPVAKCADSNNGDCAQECSDSPTGPVCSCYPGSALASDNVSCQPFGDVRLYAVARPNYFGVGMAPKGTDGWLPIRKSRYPELSCF